MRELNTASSTSCPLVSARRFLQRAVPPQQRHTLGRRQLSLNQNQQQRWAAPQRQLTLAWRRDDGAAPVQRAALWTGRGSTAQLEAAVARLLHFSHCMKDQAMRTQGTQPAGKSHWAYSDAELEPNFEGGSD